MRKDYLDNIRWSTQFLVVVYHVLYMYNAERISAVALLIGKAGILPAWLIYMLSLAAGVAAGYLLNALISRIPFFRWAVLGIRKEKKDVQG